MTRGKALNEFLVRVFRGVLRAEESSLAGAFPDLSLTEMHLIDEVCSVADERSDDRATAMAGRVGVTAGTLSTAARVLERKGYLSRRRDPIDRRIVRLTPTESGRRVSRHHALFHAQLIDSLRASLGEADLIAFERGVQQVNLFFDSLRPTSAPTPQCKGESQ